MAKDRIGNQLEKGDIVSAMIPSQRDPAVLAEVFGEIVEVRAGGIAMGTGKGAGVTNGEVVLSIQATIPFDPRTQQSFSILKLHDPSRKPQILQ